jgi:hypothetical protein
MKLFATPDDVLRAQRELDGLQSLVPPSERARAITTGCLTKILAGVVSLFGFSLSVGIGFGLAEAVHPYLGLAMGLVAGIFSLFGVYGLSNALILASYRRAIRRALDTPDLGAVSAGSSAGARALVSPDE